MGRVEFATGSDDPSSGPPGHLLPLKGEKWWPVLLPRAVAMGLAPEAFWRLSWREWQMLNGADVPVAMDRAAFEALMQEYPDR